MKTSIFDRVRDAVKVLNGTISAVPVAGYWDVKVVRADGTIEEKTIRNTVTVTGLNRLAHAAVDSAAGVMNAIVVGTATGAPALTDSQSSFGEVIRKSFIATGASAQSREWFFGVCTIAGAADAVTSVTLDSAGMTIGTTSLATSFIMNRVNGMGVTLGNSDFLNLTARVRVGSHNIAHST